MGVVEAGTGRLTDLETHADLPKHTFGSCAICTRRLRAAERTAPIVRRTRNASALPTRLLVQTSAVRGLDHEDEPT